MKIRFLPLLIVVFGMVVASFDASQSWADIVSISESTPNGNGDAVNANDYIGIVTNTGPNEIGGQAINTPNIPGGESMQIGDLVGRDVDATSGDTTWVWELILPADAVSGTGFTNISFSGRAFERANNNLEPGDTLTWQLFLNNEVTAAQTVSTANDFAPFDINLADTGTSVTVTRARIVFTVVGFQQGGEWFATRGTLSADYDQINAVPEPAAWFLFQCIGLWAVVGVRRRRR